MIVVVWKILNRVTIPIPKWSLMNRAPVHLFLSGASYSPNPPARVCLPLRASTVAAIGLRPRHSPPGAHEAAFALEADRETWALL